MMMRFTIFGMLFVLGSTALFGQSIEPKSKSIAVQVVDAAGQPIPQATIRMQQTTRFEFLTSEIRSGKFLQVPLVSDADKTDGSGHWRSPPLPANAAYYVVAEASGFAEEFGRWVHRDDTGLVMLPAFHLRRLVSLSGRVIDSGGQTVAGATVFQSGDGTNKVQTLSKEDGSFVLPRVPEGPVFIFVDAPSCYFTGRLIKSSSEAIVLVVTDRNRSNPEQLKRRAPVERNEVEIEEADRLRANAFADIKRKVGSFGQDTPNVEVAQAFANAVRIDPKAGVELFRETTFSSETVRQHTLNYVLSVLADGRSQEIELWLSEITGDRKNAMHSIMRSQTESTRRYEWLGRLLREARVHSDPTDLAANLANLAAEYRRYGYPTLAKKLLGESEQLLINSKRSESNARIYSSLCETWCEIDSQEAIRLLPQCNALSYERIGEKLAARHPELVEQLYGQYVKEAGNRPSGHWFMGLCYEMARTDLSRAERIADLVLERSDLFRPLDINLNSEAETGANAPLTSSGPAIKRAILQGFMAHARWEVGDEVQTQKLLGDAWVRLRAITAPATHTRSGFVWKPSEAMAILLPIAEQIAPDRACEFYWAAIAQRFPIPQLDSNDLQLTDAMELELAAFLHQFNQDHAEHIANLLLQRAGWRSQGGFTDYAYIARLNCPVPARLK